MQDMVPYIRPFLRVIGFQTRAQSCKAPWQLPDNLNLHNYKLNPVYTKHVCMKIWPWTVNTLILQFPDCAPPYEAAAAHS